jgi:SAM-dependent methyltransferase
MIPRTLGQAARLIGWWTGFYVPPDRRILERAILPAFAGRASCRRVLFVGVRPYVRAYQRHFPAQEYVTIDPNPRMRPFGSSRHVVDGIENLRVHFAPCYFDLIVLNGVIGWGVDSEQAAERALDACFDGLAAGGELVVGINEERSATPDLSGSAALRRFEPVVFEPLGTSRLVVPTPFAERSHTYLFFRKPPVPAARVLAPSSAFDPCGCSRTRGSAQGPS